MTAVNTRASRAIAARRGGAGAPWWSDAVFYQIYPRSFADANGDGVGDLAGVREKLGYLELLGIDALWLSPVMRSPMVDHGYDVSDPRDIDPLFGTLDDMDGLITDAHARGIKVTMDLVPNHTSDEHPWFRAALEAGPGSPERDRYVFRDGRGDGSEPPNNWPSIFGGPAWHRVTEADGTPGQWYLHIFAPEQPDLNWHNDEVRADLEATLRFWLDRGVDGFRIDVAHGLAKPADLPDMDLTTNELMRNADGDPRFDQDGVHEIHRAIRRVVDEYDAMTVGEVWVRDNERFARYLRPDELTLGFNFRLAEAAFDADEIKDAVDNSLAAVALAETEDAPGVPTWTLSNHDIDREVTRYGGGDLGTRRARAMALVTLGLPGVVFLYNGAELGLPSADVPDDARQDPAWFRSDGAEKGRDGCRVPLPWEGDTPPFGFGTGEPWLPMPADWAALTVEAQLEDTDSMLNFHRTALELRATRPEFAHAGLDWYGSPPGCLAFRRRGGLVCALNTTSEPVPLPPGSVLLSSTPVVDGMLAGDSAAWLV
ncbi:glycoside hydrolase family 13 protein [Rhodococcoides corynebacterioides]|uniref:glycoside hydrolase family 13 protein n=1 Tax=Rhodococcoides corynebacterioides TaxID=53972 RepID=UPI001C9B49BB|nr:glycoside hydrolase family 13 protein [Rhodococcus corynebacterioides]MBY6349624.1 glycoside hydrolase family 13 protein [Rhodococcus corynebacterioides]